MIRDYVRALSRLDLGRRVKAMFRFVPIEGLDEESFFAGEWEQDEQDAATDRSGDSAGDEQRTESAEKAEKAEGNVFIDGERRKADKAKKENAANMAAGERESVFEKEWAEIVKTSEKLIGDTIFEKRLENTAQERLTEVAWQENEQNERGAAAVLAKEEGKAYSLKNGAAETAERIFDEGEWLAGESGYSAGGNARDMTRIMTAERVMEPVIARIERFAERIEKTVAQAAQQQELREMEEDTLFRERLEGVLRAEMMRNGFGYDDI